MFIDNPAVKHMRICDRPDPRGNYRRTLVVETDLVEPLQTTDGDTDGLLRDLRRLHELARGGFAGFENIEVSGPAWKTTFPGGQTRH